MILLFLMWLLLASYFSEDRITSFKAIFNIFPFLLLSTIILNIKNKEEYNLIFLFLTLLSLVSSTALLIVAALKPNGYPPGWMAELGSPLYIVPNDLILLSVILPITISLVGGNCTKKIKIICIISCVLSLTAIVIFQSRSALLIYFISAFIYLIKSSFNWRRNLLISLTSLSVFAFIFIWITLFKGSDTGGIYFGEGRVKLWLSAFLMFTENPLLGFGPGTFGLFYEEFLDKLSLPQSFLHDYRHTPWPHNLYLEILAETGLPGFIFFWLVCWSAINIKKNNMNIGCDSRHQLAVLSSLYAILIAGFIELSFIRIWVIMILVVIFTLGFNLRRHSLL